MTVSALLAPIPKWVIMDNSGRPAGGAKLYTYRNLNPTQQKTVYQDPSLSSAWTNPIVFDSNGSQGPFYWEVDSDNLDDTYYLEAYDSNNNLLWTIEDYFPPGDGGGGSSTTYVSLANLIANNTFLDHIDDTANPTNTTNLVLAPSNHKGFTPADLNPVSTSTAGVVGPDIRFVKNNTDASDQITFVNFSGNELTGDITPPYYLRYQCNNSPVGETYKGFQFPITQNIFNLNNEVVSFTIWARSGTNPHTLSLYTRQYYGTGGSPSTEDITFSGSLSLTTSWQKFVLSFTIPSTSGKTLSSTGDDALYMQLWMPLGQVCDVWFTKPSLFIGDINPGQEYITYDQVDSVTQTFRTSDTKTSFISTAQKGWVAMNDGSIGSASSGATTRANIDTFCLYKTIWDGVSDTYAPVATGRGATASADFNSNKALTLPRSLGRALAGAGAGSGLTSRALGEYLGSETHTLSIAEMPAHNHPNSVASDVRLFAAGSSGSGNFWQNFGGINLPISVTSQGGGTAHTIMQPTSFMNVFIKL
jgi:hypothetical protein